MFAKLIGVLLLILATTASAYDEPMEFQDVEAAKAWFKKAYPHSEMRNENVTTRSGSRSLLALSALSNTG